MTTFVIRKLCRNVGERRMDSGYYDPSTVAPDEQPAYPTTAYPYVKPPRSSCSTHTYKVPSEAGGEASVNVVRC